MGYPEALLLTFRHRAGVRLYTSSFEFAQPCVFVKQLPGPILCASYRYEDPLSRSYGVSLPSSLATTLSTPQYVLPDYVCPFAVRVPQGYSLAVFLGSMITCTISSFRRRCRTIRSQLSGWICLPRSTPTPFNADIRHRAAVSLLRHHVAPYGSHGILTVSAIGLAVRLILRTRLTPG